MGRLIRAYDWENSSLGSPAAWPQPLRCAISLMLGSKFPMFLLWGRPLVQLYNDSYIALLGNRHPLALGAPFSSTWSEIWSDLAPLVERALDGEAVFFDDLPLTLLRNGYPEPAWFTFSYSPIHDGAGVGGMFCVCTETTARVNAERRGALVLKTVDRLRCLSTADDIAKAGIEMLGRHFDVRHACHGEIDTLQGTFHVRCGWARGDARPLAGQVGRLDDFGPDIISTLRSGTALAVDDVVTDRRTADHAPAFAAIGVRSILMLPLVNDGQLMATLNLYDSLPHRWSGEDLAVAADVAERIWSAMMRARGAETVRQAERRKDEFLAMLAHELRNPLAPISSAAELLNRGQLDPGQIRKTSGIIVRQVRHMTGLIDELLDASRVTRGVVLLHKEEIDVKSVVADAIEQVRPVLEERHHHFSLDMAPGSALVFGDYKRLVQVFGNLIHNAAKFTPEGGTVSLRVASSAEHVELWVTDDGVGMTPELMSNIFELFSQADSTSDRAQGGLGLGLALVKSMLELHGASVSACSKGPRAGSQFHVRLPRLAQHGARLPPEACPAPAGPARCKLRILIVDDNVDAADTLAMLLDSRLHQISVAYGAMAALALARADAFDVFLLDIGLADMDGNELARRIRTLAAPTKVSMVAISGYGPPDAAASGFDHYFVKPADPAQLLALLAGIGKAHALTPSGAPI